MWCIPPIADARFADARFVSAMEDVMEVYEQPYDRQRPVVCLDEAAKQVLGEVRAPWPTQPGQEERFDNEYERRGTCALFMLFEPLVSWCEVVVRARRTGVDYADVVRYLCDEKYPDVEKIVLVQDNLNTHGAWSLYEAFEPHEAQRLAQWIEWHYTPKHGSWLNMAEIELSVLARQCLQERMDRSVWKRNSTLTSKSRHGSNDVTRQRFGWSGASECRMHAVNSSAFTLKYYPVRTLECGYRQPLCIDSKVEKPGMGVWRILLKVTANRVSGLLIPCYKQHKTATATATQRVSIS